MANTLLTIDMITREALRILENNLTFTKYIARDYDDQYAQGGAKIGDTLRIRKPARYTIRTGQTLALQNHIETQVPLTLEWQDGVDINFTSQELALSIDDFSQRILAPAVSQVANQVDQRGLELYKQVYNVVGTPGTVVADYKTYLQAGAYMDDEATPRDNMRSMVIEPWAQVELIDTLKGLFHSTTEIERQYEEGTMGLSAGFKWSMDQNIATHQAGASVASTVTMNGATANLASTLNLTGFANNTTNAVRAGDVFTIAGVNAVNPKSRMDTGKLRYFVATANASSNASGEVAVPIAPAVITSDIDLPGVGQGRPAFQTVTALPASGAAVTFSHATNDAMSKQNMAFHRDAFQMGCADLPLPDGVDRAARISDAQLGMSIRMVRAYDINQDQFPCRLDFLYGWVAQYPELACRVQG